MENASKALIIAGAILISILLITLGIAMFRSSEGTTDQAGAASDAMQSGAQTAIGQLRNDLELNKVFNSQFDEYIDQDNLLDDMGYNRGNMNGAKLKQLMALIEQSNKNNPNNQIVVYGAFHFGTQEIIDTSNYKVFFYYKGKGQSTIKDTKHWVPNPDQVSGSIPINSIKTEEGCIYHIVFDTN